MADKNLDQLEQVLSSTPSDKLHIRRNGQDLAITTNDFVSTAVTVSGGITDATNTGTGAGKVFKTKTGSTLEFKSIAGSGNVSVSNGTNDVTISVAPDSGKADKAIPSATGNLASLNASGNLVDSGYDVSDFATAAQGDLADTALQDITNESIGDLADVNLTGIAAGDTLVWDGINSEFVPGTPSDPDVAWTTPTLSNGWTVNVTYGIQHRVMKGILYITGVVTAGTKTNGTEIFTLPSGSCPATARAQPVGSLESGADAGAHVTISTDGAVEVQNINASHNNIVFSAAIGLS